MYNNNDNNISNNTAASEAVVESAHDSAPRTTRPCDITITKLLSCAIHTHTPARKSSTNFQLLYKFVLQTGLGMGMGINGTAHITKLLY